MPQVFICLCSQSYAESNDEGYLEWIIANNPRLARRKPIIHVWHSGSFPPKALEEEFLSTGHNPEERIPRGNHPLTHDTVSFETDVVDAVYDALAQLGVTGEDGSMSVDRPKDSELTAFLKELRMVQYEQVLRDDLGVETVDDLLEMTEEDWLEIRVKPMELKRVKKALLNHAQS